MYKDAPNRKPRDEEERVMQEWRKVVDANTFDATIGSKGVNWDAVDRWEATLPPAAQAILNNSPVNGLSPLDKQFAEAKRKIAATGYWDTRDEIWNEFAELYGVRPGTTYEDARHQFEVDIMREMLASGVPQGMAELQTQKLSDARFKQYLDLVGKIDKAMLKDPVLADLLLRWGYKTSRELQQQLIDLGVR